MVFEQIIDLNIFIGGSLAASDLDVYHQNVVFICFDFPALNLMCSYLTMPTVERGPRSSTGGTGGVWVPCELDNRVDHFEDVVGRPPGRQGGVTK